MSDENTLTLNMIIIFWIITALLSIPILVIILSIDLQYTKKCKDKFGQQWYSYANYTFQHQCTNHKGETKSL